MQVNGYQSLSKNGEIRRLRIRKCISSLAYSRKTEATFEDFGALTRNCHIVFTLRGISLIFAASIYFGKTKYWVVYDIGVSNTIFRILF